MSFDAGAATGRLELDTSGFTGGIMEAEGIARIFPEVVTDFIANPLLGVAEIFKELGETAIDTFTEVTNDAENMGLLSQKLGVAPEVFSQWAQLAKTVHVAPEQLAMGVKMLEEEAAKALEGEGKFNEERQARREKAAEQELEFEAKHHGRTGNFLQREQEWEAEHAATNAQAAAFARLGISLNDLRDSLNDPMALFQKIKDAIDAVPDPIERMRLATELLGSRQSALVPVLTMSKEHVDAFAKATQEMGGITSASETQAAQAFTDLQTEAGIALEGIKKAAMMPILDYITAHAADIQKEIVKLSADAQEEIGKIWNYLKGPGGKAIIDEIKADVKIIIADLPAIGAELKDIYTNWLKPMMDGLGWVAGKMENLREWATGTDAHGNPDQTGINMVAAAVGHPLLQEPLSPHMRPKSDTYTPTPGDNIGEEQHILSKIQHNAATPQDYQRFHQLMQADNQAAAAGAGQSVHISVGHMDVHVGGSSSNGPIDKAFQDKVNQALAKNASQANSQSALSGSD
jgi:hypothetical protein